MAVAVEESPQMSCVALMRHMEQQEQDGDQVCLHVVSLSAGLLVTVARSPRRLALQFSNSDKVETIPWNNGPRHSKSDFFDDDEGEEEEEEEEYMTSSTVLPMPYWALKRQWRGGEEEKERRRRLQRDEEPVLQDDDDAGAEGDEDQHPVAIIMVGTSHCRVFCIPMVLPNDSSSSSSGSSVLAPWEPLPLSSTSLVRTTTGAHGEGSGDLNQGKLVVLVNPDTTGDDADRNDSQHSDDNVSCGSSSVAAGGGGVGGGVAVAVAVGGGGMAQHPPSVDDVSTASVTSRRSICSTQHTLATASQANLSQHHLASSHLGGGVGGGGGDAAGAAGASGGGTHGAVVAFEPTGGVLQLTPFSTHFVWITYGDGTAVRLPQSLCRWTALSGPSAFSLDAGHPQEEDGADEAPLEETIIWTKLPLCSSDKDTCSPSFLPLPLHHPSLLMPPPPPPSPSLHRNASGKLLHRRRDSGGWTEEDSSYYQYYHHQNDDGDDEDEDKKKKKNLDRDGVDSDAEMGTDEEDDDEDDWFYEDPFVTLSHRAYTHALVWLDPANTTTTTTTTTTTNDATLSFYTSEDWTTTAFVDAEHRRRLRLYHELSSSSRLLQESHHSSDSRGGGMSRTSSSASLLAEIGYEVVKTSVGALLNMTSLMGGYSSGTAAAPPPPKPSQIPLTTHHVANTTTTTTTAMPKAYWGIKRDDEDDDDEEEEDNGRGEEGSSSSLGSSLSSSARPRRKKRHKEEEAAPISSLYTAQDTAESSSSTAAAAAAASSLNPPVIHMRPVRELNALGHLWCDAPRQITAVSVDPTGSLAALSDSLGRVSLMDLETKQLVRLFKGVRDASACAWMNCRQRLYVVIYAPLRRVVQIFRVRHGPRVACFSVPGPIVLIPAWGVAAGDGEESEGGAGGGGEQEEEEEEARDVVASCYIYHKNTKTLELLTFTDPDVQQQEDGTEASTAPSFSKRGVVAPLAPPPAPSSPPPVPTSTIATLPVSPLRRGRRPSFTKLAPASAPPSMETEVHSLRMLQQLLSVEGEVRPDAEVLYAALAKITTIQNLVVALDELAVAENAQPLEGSTFHAIVICYCQKVFDDVMVGTTLQVTQSAHLQSLSIRLDIHQQIMAAYDVLHNFEVAEEANGGGGEAEEPGEDRDDDDDDRDEHDGGGPQDYTKDVPMMEPQSPWAAEAVGWMAAFEDATGRSLDADVFVSLSKKSDVLAFPHFARACLLDFKESRLERESGGAYRIFLCQATKERQRVLGHVFKPLLRDVFVLQFVFAVFDGLKIRNEVEKLQEYFGEWFMTLSLSHLSRASLYTPWSPPVRWLQDLCGTVLEQQPQQQQQQQSGKSQTPAIVLGTLHQYCRESEHLVRAFSLACVCRQAVSAAASQAEAKTYGKVLERNVVQPWDTLLRQLRLCLLVTLRLYGARLGPLPLTVSRVDEGRVFSPYEWLALDELSMSHNAEEVCALEQACRVSPFMIHPTCTKKWQVVQRAATQRAARDDPLLLYLGDFVRPLYLGAHRALLLAKFWGREPDSLDLLSDCVSVLRGLDKLESDGTSLAAAVRLEVWQVHIRPIYRALLFGFDDVPELSEDVVGPLCDDSSWLRQVNTLALEILALVRETPTVAAAAAEAPEEKDKDDDEDEEESRWPREQGDVVLAALVSRPRSVDLHSLEVHRAVLYAAQLSDDPESWAVCVPLIGGAEEELFLATCLFQAMPPPIPSLSSLEPTEEYMEFLEGALQRKALEGESVELEDLENLGRLWGMSGPEMRARLVLAMYHVGKDAMAEQVLEEGGGMVVHVEVFREGGFDILSRRLERILTIVRRVKRYRGILGMLDADTVVWIKERAQRLEDGGNGSRQRRRQRRRRQRASSKDEEAMVVSLAGETHALILRLLRMSCSERVHALSVLSGTLVNAIRHANVGET